MNMKIWIAVILSLLLAACGGGGENGEDEVAMPDDEVMPEEMTLATDPRIEQLGGIVERTDVLLMPAMHVNYEVSALGETTSDSVLQPVSCEGAACTASGVTIDLADFTATDLIDPDVDISVNEAELRTRDDGFHTASITGTLAPPQLGVLHPDITITEIPEVQAYGFWGEHGMAGLSLADGPFSGRAQNVPISGDMQIALPYAFGDTSGSNPSGVGEASWTGIAEVVALITFRRQEGTVTLTIPDLLAPTVNVDLRNDTGDPIGEAGWTDLPLESGHFMVGTAGDDYLEGNFHGANHSEAYGVFDTNNFTGAFGAMRAAPGE